MQTIEVFREETVISATCERCDRVRISRHPQEMSFETLGGIVRQYQSDPCNCGECRTRVAVRIPVLGSPS